jgi:quinolinate synthase
MSPAELDERITAAREELGTQLVVLGHHYQRDEVVKYADFRGDSFKLSQQAASRKDVRYIVFCGVHFMAESADILSEPEQAVILPNMAAGCSMADMAATDDVLACWASLNQVTEDKIIPITYMNSAAALKAFCGKYDGAVCTSSNATAVLTWALERGRKVLFFPDQHLGRNTALKLGYSLDDMVVWNPHLPMGGNSPEEIERATFILWRGHCSVHGRFSVEQIKQARERYPDVNVIVHPECKMEVVQASDLNGSTEVISNTITAAPAGTIWAVGTEINLVNRLAQEQPDKTIYCLDPVICPCSTMYRIHPAYIAWVLDKLVAGRVVNRVKVDSEVAKWALVSLDRMLAIT